MVKGFAYDVFSKLEAKYIIGKSIWRIVEYCFACAFSKTGNNDMALAEYRKLLKLASKEDPRVKK